MEPFTLPVAVRAENSPVRATAELEAYLNRVEFYQPLYGISGFEDPLRTCRDRAVAIERAIEPICPGLRLIDFGSSLGYFPFYFSDRGAITKGLDLKPENTAVALATQRLNGLPAMFRTGCLDLETVRVIEPGEFDVALMLSVLHHITQRHGIDYVTTLLRELLARIPTLILELAHRDEAVEYTWRASLPESPLAILDACGKVDIKLLGQFPSHLSTSLRPMYRVTR